jgi:hypothetical protein
MTVGIFFDLHLFSAVSEFSGAYTIFFVHHYPYVRLCKRPCCCVNEAKREYELANTLPTQSASLPSIEPPGPVVVLYYERLITLQEATLSDFFGLSGFGTVDILYAGAANSVERCNSMY